MQRKNNQEMFGEKVRKYRIALGLSQENLGFRAGLDRTYISGIERGNRNPSLKSAGRIAEALGTHLGELLCPCTGSKAFTFDKTSYLPTETIEELYQKKIDILLDGRERAKLYNSENDVYSNLIKGQKYDPRRSDVHFASEETARKGKKIADKLDAMTEEEFLGSRYPHAWLEGLWGDLLKLGIEKLS